MSFDLTAKRYIKESGLEARVSAIVEPVANSLGYALVRVRITQENGMTLQIMAEDENGRFTIVDCETLSKDLSPVLDVEDPIEREYHLEVSSPGIDRPLVRQRDFAAHIGHEAKIELSDMLNGRKRFRGFIKAVAVVTKRIPVLQCNGQTVHTVGLPNHWGFMGLAKKGYAVNTLTPFVGDANTNTPEFKSFLVNIEKA